MILWTAVALTIIGKVAKDKIVVSIGRILWGVAIGALLSILRLSL
jgi:hypothetical protein